MKNKFLMLTLAILLCFSTFTLTACAGSMAGGSTSSGNSSNFDPTQNPKPEDPPKGDNETDSANFEDFFSGYRVLIDGDENFEIKDDATNAMVKFNYLLDRQITVLAEDILYRLYVTYGENTYGANNEIAPSEKDLLYNSNNYSLNGNNAIVKKVNLLTTLSDHDKNIDSHTTNLDCIYCYQNFINGNENKLNSPVAIILKEAITGEYCMYDSSMGSLVKHNNPDTPYDSTPYMWQFNDSSLWYSDYLNKFKMALAKILVGDSENYLLDAYSENDYNNLLNRINRLGFYVTPETNPSETFVYDDVKVLDYIEKNIIGTNLIEENLRIYNSFTEQEKGNIINWNDTEDNIKKHFYKGYNIVLPNIVKMAFSNTFKDSTESLYPTCLRTDIYDGNFETKPGSDSEMTTTGPIKFNSLILKPKEGSLPNEFVLSIAVARDSEPDKTPGDISTVRYVKDIVVSFKVNMVYKTTKGEGFNQIVKAYKENSETLTVDSAGWTPPPYPSGKPSEGVGYLPYQFTFTTTDYLSDPPPSLGEYNGASTTLKDMSLWDNAFQKNDSNTALSFMSGDNYLQISFVDVVVMQRTSSGDVVYTGDDVVYDISIMPLTF